MNQAHNIHIDAEGYLYVVGAADHDIWIYDLSNPSEPDSVGAWEGEYLHDIEVYNNKLYGAAIYSGLFYIVDVSDKTNPTTLISHETGIDFGTHDCAVTENENYLIIADEKASGHISIWDISDYENINRVSEYIVGSNHSVHNVYVRPGTDLAIISYYVDGTRVLDISDPTDPIEVGYFDTSDLTGLFDGNWGTYAYLPSGYIISSDRSTGLYILKSPLLPNFSMEWSDCTDIVEDNLTCYGDIYQAESEVMQEIINLNTELAGLNIEDISSFSAGRVFSVDLSSRGLTSLALPYNFGNLSSLSYLQLQDNQLATLPENITDSQNISTLNISGNQLSVFPVGIVSLQRLYRLDISNNLLTSIPESILTVNSLIEFDISGNQLTTIPDSIGVLTNLEIFQLNGNDISTLPSTLCDLPDDCMIDVTGNHLCSEILQTVEECVTTISYQYCDDCVSGFMLDNFCSNPTDIIVLQSIIDSNESLIGQHPLILGHNTQYSTWNNGNLEYLDLSDYNLTNIPNSVGDFEFLIEINLDGNLISNLADSITNLDRIKILRLNNNLLSKIPDNIGNLTSLEELYLSGNQLTFIPESISNLQNLKKLFIRANQITSLPPTICNLPDNCNIQVQDNCLNASYECISNMGDQDNCPTMAINNYQPIDFQLFTPYPNPFNPIITISYYQQSSGLTTIQILDLNGRVIATLSNEITSSGYHTLNWNASDYSSGVYFIKMNVGDSQSTISQSRKVVLLK